MKKIYSKTWVFITFLIISPIVTLAQGPGGDLPCGGDDPLNSDCPLDTWVIVLVIIALTFTVFHLRKKQKSLQV